jgi:F-type H+-transporting ATPase subunit epsilon
MKIQLDIVTPKGRALSVAADEVTAPSSLGEFGVMPGHVPLLASLRSGIVTYKVGADSKRCAVGSGFAEVGPERMTLLVDDCVEQEGLDPVAVKKLYQEAEAEYNAMTAKEVIAGEHDDAHRLMIGKLNWLATQLELCGQAAPALIRLLEEQTQSEEQHVEPETSSAGDA